jgi:hypothetical protein
MAADPSTVYWALHTRLTLNHPVTEVWPLFQDMRRWYTEYAFEVISGPAYEPGVGLLEHQVLKLTSSVGFPKTPGTDDPLGGAPYFTSRIVRVAPQEQIVAAIYGAAYDFKRQTSFYVWRMVTAGSDTAIHVDTYGEAELIQPLDPEGMAQYTRELERNWQRSWSEAFLNLGKII